MADNHIIWKYARGTSEVLSQYSGPTGEVVVDTTLHTLRVQDGTAGGMTLVRKPDLDAVAEQITNLAGLAGDGLIFDGNVYLVDPNYILQIIKLAEVLPADAVYERGCGLYRSANGIATTIVYKDAIGRLAKMEVIDAQYRSDDYLAFGTTGTDTTLGNFQNNNGIDSNFGQGELGDYRRTDLPDYITNDLVCNLWGPVLKTDKSAEENCNVWLTYTGVDSANITGTPAVAACRSLTTDSSNGHWNLPNLYELIILFMLADKIDDLDPTVSAYASKKIGKTHASGRFCGNNFWTSTERSSNYVRFVAFYGHCGYTSKSALNRVLPIRELSV